MEIVQVQTQELNQAIASLTIALNNLITTQQQTNIALNSLISTQQSILSATQQTSAGFTALGTVFAQSLAPVASAIASLPQASSTATTSSPSPGS